MKVAWGRGFLAVVMLALVGWPLLATIVAAVGGLDAGPGGGSIGPPPPDVAAGRLPRVVALGVTTGRLVLLTEAVALPAGIVVALLLFRTDVAGRRAMIGLLALSAFVPMPLHATAWLGAFGNAGRAQALGASPILVGLPGAAFVHAAAAIPWIVLLAGVGLAAVEPELEEAGLLDLPAWRVLIGVTARRAIAPLAGAALAVAVLVAGDMTVTDLLQVRTFAEEAYVQFQLGGGPSAAASVSLPPLVVLGGLLMLGARALLRADPSRLASPFARAKTWKLGRWRGPLGLALAAGVGGLVCLPVVTLAWRAGRVGGSAAAGLAPHWSLAGLLGTLRFAIAEVAGGALKGPLRDALTTGHWPRSLGSESWLGDPGESPLLASLFVSALAASAASVLAWSLAWSSRGRGFWRGLTAASVALLLATPGPVAGMALVLAFRDVAWVYDSAMILVLAGVVRTLPYALLVLWPAVRAVSRDSLETAALDGCGPWGQLRWVAWPATSGATIAAWGVAFVLALGELPASNLVAPPGTPPIAVVVWSLLHTGVESHLSGVALVMLAAIAAAGLVAVVALSRAGFGPGDNSRGA